MKNSKAALQADLTLCYLHALVVLGRWDPLRRALRKAAKEGIAVESIREILLQSHLFAGYPRTIEAFEIFTSIEASGMWAGKQNSPVEGPGNYEERGAALFRKIYLSHTDEVLERIRSFHPDLKDWILQHAYGRVLSRPFLSAKQRELAAVAALTVTRQYRQLLSHLRGAKRCGATAEEMAAVLQKMKSIAAPAVIKKAQRMLEQS